MWAILTLTYSDVSFFFFFVSEFFSTLSAKDFFFRSSLFSSEKGSVSNVWFYFLYLFRGTWRCFLLMNFEVSCQIPFSRKWFSAFRAEHRCPINLFVVMCLDMSVKVLLVWCFVSARWTCEDCFGCFLFPVVLSHVISLRVFPNEVFLTHRAGKGTFIMLLIGEQQDRLPLQRILHIRYKGSPFCSKAWIGLIQIFILRLVIITFQCNWFLNFPSRYSNFEKHEAKWIEIMLVCKMNWSIIWSSHQNLVFKAVRKTHGVLFQLIGS